MLALRARKVSFHARWRIGARILVVGGEAEHRDDAARRDQPPADVVTMSPIVIEPALARRAAQPRDQGEEDGRQPTDSAEIQLAVAPAR